MIGGQNFSVGFVPGHSALNVFGQCCECSLYGHKTVVPSVFKNDLKAT